MCASKKVWRQMASQGESSHGVSEGAPAAAPQTPKADKEASASEGAPVAAPQARAEADPEPSPQKTLKCGVLPSLRKRKTSQGSTSSGSRDQIGRGAEEQEQGVARDEYTQPKAPESTAARTAINTAQPQKGKNEPSRKLEPTTVYYSNDGMKTGIFHIVKQCRHLSTANQIREATEDFARSHKHRICKRCWMES